MKPKIYTVKQAAELLGVARTTVYKLIARGQLRRHSIGDTVVITEYSIARYQRDRKQPGRPNNNSKENKNDM